MSFRLEEKLRHAVNVKLTVSAQESSFWGMEKSETPNYQLNYVACQHVRCLHYAPLAFNNLLGTQVIEGE
jgi:hypothetical protein